MVGVLILAGVGFYYFTDISKPQKIKFFSGKKIKDIFCGDHSLVLLGFHPLKNLKILIFFFIFFFEIFFIFNFLKKFYSFFYYSKKFNFYYFYLF